MTTQKHMDALSNVIESAEWASRHGDEWITKKELKLAEELYDLISETTKEAKKYHKGFSILMDYFALLPDEDKPTINKKLKRLGL